MSQEEIQHKGKYGRELFDFGFQSTILGAVEKPKKKQPNFKQLKKVKNGSFRE